MELSKQRVISLLLALLLLGGCAGGRLMVPDLGELYSDLAQQEDPYRNPIVVIPWSNWFAVD